MNITTVEVVGLVGVVLVVSAGKIFNPLREFLRSFSHKHNPFPWVADLISCSMCTGVWVGVIWGVVHSWSWESIVVFSGFLSLISFVASELLGVLGVLTLRSSRVIMGSHQYQGAPESAAVALAGARARARNKSRKVAPGDNLTEDEADALLDQETEKADLFVVSSEG